MVLGGGDPRREIDVERRSDFEPPVLEGIAAAAPAPFGDGPVAPPQQFGDIGLIQPQWAG